MASVDTMFTRALLREAVKLVRLHYPEIKLRESYVMQPFRGHWEFHGPEKFYWHGRAHDAYEARYKGWTAWLRKKGIGDA